MIFKLINITTYIFIIYYIMQIKNVNLVLQYFLKIYNFPIG